MSSLAVNIWDRMDLCAPGCTCASQDPFFQNLRGIRETLISSPVSILPWSVLTQAQHLPRGKSSASLVAFSSRPQ